MQLLTISYKVIEFTFPPTAGFPPGMSWGSSPKRKKYQSFKFECLKWPILIEMTAKSGIYCHFLCQQRGDTPPPPCGAERGGLDPSLAGALH